jgi:hypothetical protein
MRMTGTGPTERPAFVLHDHRTPRPHFDLRLEEDGVLRSWAVPRGLPTGWERSTRYALIDTGDAWLLRRTTEQPAPG